MNPGDIVDKYVKGLRVVRGPDWDYEDQDGGAGSKGTILRMAVTKGWVVVKWDDLTKKINSYRIGCNDKYDLCVATEEEK